MKDENEDLKAEEPAGVYHIQPSRKTESKNVPPETPFRSAELESVRRANAKLVEVHQDVLRKLAQ